MSNLAQRVLTAVIAIPLVFVLLWFGDVSRITLICLLGGVGAWEWARMAGKMNEGPNVNYLAFASTVMLVLAWVFDSGKFLGLMPLPNIVPLVAMIVFGLYIAVAYAKVSIEHLFPWLVTQLAAPIYLGLWGGMSVLMLGSGSQDLKHCYAFILLMTSMWGCDTAAYFFGKFAAGKGPFGRHALAPSISPKKTWEGAVVGTLFTMIWVGYWTNCSSALAAFDVQFNWISGVLLGFVFAVVGQAGDLLMSALKRWSGTKDSGNLFVGHGGALDRCDSFFLAAPVLVILLEWL